MSTTIQRTEVDYGACMGLVDFLQRLRGYLSFNSKRELCEQLGKWANKVNAIEWRGLPSGKIQIIANIVGMQTYDSSITMEEYLEKYTRRIGGRIFDNDEARYSFLPLFDRDSPTFIGYTLYPDFYERR